MQSNDELFAKAHTALWIYESDLETPLTEEEKTQFIIDFILSEQKPNR